MLKCLAHTQHLTSDIEHQSTPGRRKVAEAMAQAIE